jgi:MFS family permease
VLCDGDSSGNYGSRDEEHDDRELNAPGALSLVHQKPFCRGAVWAPPGYHKAMIHRPHLHRVELRRQWLILGFGVMGLTAAATMLVFYLPVVLSRLTHSEFLIGFAVGVEGLIALTVPLLIGQASDHTWNRFGRRIPYLLAGAPLVIAGLVVASLVNSYWLIVAAVAAFFIGYYIYYTAYQALYPDTLPSSEYGRAWAIQSIFQGIAVGLALIGGGALIGFSLKGPFIGAAIFFLVITIITVALVREHKRKVAKTHHHFYSAFGTFVRRIKGDGNLRLFLAAHFCWEYALAAIRAFVILYLLKGLGIGDDLLVWILSLVVVTYLVAALVSGAIIDRFDPRNYTAWVVIVFAIVMLVTGLSTDMQVLSFLLPFGVFTGAATLMLSYPILLRVTPPERRGEYTGYYQANRGLALLLGTTITGAFIDKFGHAFPQTDGYQVLWIVTGVVVLLSVPPLLALTAGGKAKVGA